MALIMPTSWWGSRVRDDPGKQWTFLRMGWRMPSQKLGPRKSILVDDSADHREGEFNVFTRNCLTGDKFETLQGIEKQLLFPD